MALLTPAEQQLCLAIGEGRVAEFASNEVIAADTIRQIALGIILDGQASPVNCPAGVRIRGATVSGRIDLANAGQGGQAPITLVLEECVLQGGIDARHAVFAALSLHQSKIAFTPGPGPDGRLQPPIDLVDTHVCGALQLSGIAPLSDETYCYVRAEGAAIDGNVDLARATLRAPAMDPARPLDDGGTAALDLSLARIDGDLNMVGAPHITGAVRMRCTEVTGDVWIIGAQIVRADRLIDGSAVSEDSDADACLFMQGMNVGGSVNIRGNSDNRAEMGELKPVRAYGNVSLSLAQIGESLDFLSCRINGTLNLEAAKIEKAVRIMQSGSPEARVCGGIEANDIVVGADLWITMPVDGDFRLFDATIGGSLDLSGLDQRRGNLILRSATVGRTLRIAQAKKREIIAMRSKQLTCIPGMTFIEVLAKAPDAAERPVQAGFLARRNDLWRLEGKADLLPALVKRFGHRINSAEMAEEYLRLYCFRHEGADGRCGMMLLAPESDHPLGLTLDHSDDAAERVFADDIDDAAHRDRIAATRDRATQVADFDVLAREEFPLRCKREADGRYVFDAAIVHYGEIVRCEMTIDATDPRHVTVVPTHEGTSGLVVANAPRIGAVFVEPADDAATDGLSVDFMSPPAFAGMRSDAPGKGCDQLLPYLRSGFSVSGHVNLSEAACTTLDDASGLAWGSQTLIFNNHFSYSRTNWGDDQDRSRIQRARGFSLVASGETALERFRFRFFRIAWAIRQIAMRLLRGHPESRYRGQEAEWRHRNAWIRRQFESVYPSGKRVLDGQAYRPQPYEQIIKVSRAEGYEDYAVRFEIEKRAVEAGIRGRKLRLWTATVGLIAAALAAVFLPPGGAALGTTGLILLVLAVFLAVTYFLDIANFMMRHGFGYLMRPFNAMVTLAALFGLGWWGVHLANGQRMMVVDFDPVASVAFADGESVEIGSGRGDSVVSNIHCSDEINEALYALDVLIPLIDLRQEEKCEVGLATVPVAATQAHDRTALWSFAKAAYAIFGWIVVSLVILTFVNTFRTKSGD